MENYMFHKSNVNSFFPLASKSNSFWLTWKYQLFPHTLPASVTQISWLVSSSNSCNFIQIFCIAVVHRPETIMFPLFRAVCRQAYRASSSSNINQCNATETKRDIFMCTLWAPSPTDFGLTRERESLSRVTWPINMYTTIPGVFFVIMHSGERQQTSNEEFQFNHWVT